MKPRFRLVLVASATAHGETYRVTVTRKEANVCRVDGTKTDIQTKYCYEHAHSEEAILGYDRYASDNKLILDKGATVTTCDVEQLLSE